MSAHTGASKVKFHPNHFLNAMIFKANKNSATISITCPPAITGAVSNMDPMISVVCSHLAPISSALSYASTLFLHLSCT
jgi:hypothetical protein